MCFKLDVNTECFVEPVHRCCCGFTHGHPCSGARKLRWHSGALSALLFLSWGERSVEAQRNTCSGLLCLWQGEGSVIHLGSFSSFLLRRKQQKQGFFPLVCPQQAVLQPQSFWRRWLCLLSPGRYQAVGLQFCICSPSPAPTAAVFVSHSPMSLLYFSPLDPGCYAWRSPARPWPRKSHWALGTAHFLGAMQGGSGLELKYSLEPCWMEERPFGPTAHFLQG